MRPAVCSTLELPSLCQCAQQPNHHICLLKLSPQHLILHTAGERLGVPRRDDPQQGLSSLVIHHPYLGITPLYITHISMLKVLGRTHASGRQSGRTRLMSRAFNPPDLPPGDLLAGVPPR